MKYQLDFFGVIVPSLVLWSVVAYFLARAATRFMGKIGLYRHVWHAALFDFSIFVCIVAGLVFASREFLS